MNSQEPTTVGLSPDAKKKLQWLQDENHIRYLLDGYRFAIGLALAQGVDPPEVRNSTTMFNLGTFDPDHSVKHSIEALMGDRIRGASIYKMAERLAEWGVNELASQAQVGSIDFAGLLDQADEKDAIDT